MKKIMFILVLMLISINANAVEDYSGTIKRIFPDSNGYINFKINNEIILTNKTNFEYFRFLIDSPAGKAWYSLLLSAANTGTAIRVNVDEIPNTGSIVINYILQDY